jgi:hypothetical protein
MSSVALVVLSTGCGGGPTQPTTSPTQSTTPVPPRTFNVSACQSLDAPGTYALSGDVYASSEQATCIAIHQSSVTLECGQHSVSGILEIGPNLSSVTVQNCGISVIAATLGSTNLTITNSHIAWSVWVRGGHGTIIRNNDIVIRSGRAGVVILDGGTNNQVLANRIDGGYQGSDTSGTNVGNAPAADDGIVIANEDGDRIQNNTIANAWDAGIEGVSVVSNTVISGNTIVNAVFAGIASYHCTSWKNNTVDGNAISQSRFALLFKFDRDQCGFYPPSGPGYFTDNSFADNRFDSAFDDSPYGVLFALTAVQATGNLLKGNDFRPGPVSIAPIAGFADGGGKFCGPSSTWPSC